MHTQRHTQKGLTLSEILTVLVVLVVLVAIAIPTWRIHDLRARRGDASDALIAVQTAQEQFFARNASYADGAQLALAYPQGLGLKTTSAKGQYQIAIKTTDDGLGYEATARAISREGEALDSRCVEFRIDQVGRRNAVDDQGADRSADCWQ